MKNIKKVFKNKDLRKRILITLGFLFIFRLGTALTLPGITINSIDMVDSTVELLSIINTLGGGSLEQFSIFSMGVGPYITASIIIELLSMDVIPVLSQWKKEGEKGREKQTRAMAITAVFLSFVQAFSLIYLFDKSYNIVKVSSTSSYLYLSTLMTAGTMICVWIGNQISKKGVGNGMSLLIFTGIVSTLPTGFLETFDHIVTYKDYWTFLWFGLFVLVYFIIIYFVIYTENSVRKIPIMYANNSHTVLMQDKTHLPMKINISGVIPVIFASSILVAPQVVASFINDESISSTISHICNYQEPLGFSIYVILIIIFSFFYAHLQMNTKQITDDLKKNEGNIPGIRVGEETKKYLDKTINKITVFGVIVLIVIAIIPILSPLLWEEAGHLPISLGGTSLIIMSSVALESCKQLKNQIKRKEYTKDYKLFSRGGR